MGLINRILTAAKVLAGYHLQEWSPDRRFWVNQSQDAKKDIPYGVRRSMLSWAREMERKDPIFNAFLELCERYVIGPSGLRIVSGSTNADWAALANAEWDAWQPWCDVSSRFSFGQRQGLIEREVEVAGECFIFLTFGSTNRPRIQLIPSENVETPPEKAQEKNITDGIRLDENDRPTAYFLRQRDGVTFREVPAENIVHIFEPSRIGQVRGLSIIYPVLKDMIDLQESIDLEVIAHKDAAQISRFITNELGERKGPGGVRRAILTGSTQTPAGTATTENRQEYYSTAFGGRVVYGKRGDSMQQTKNDRPSDAVRNFWDFVSAREAAGLGLPIEIMIMRSLQGTMTRAALDMAAAFFRCRAAARAESFGQVWQHVAFNTSTLRRGMPQDWRKTRYTPPRSINVDNGRNSAALIAEYEKGWRTFESICAELGYTEDEVMRSNCRTHKRAQEIEAEENVPPGTALRITTTDDQPQQGDQLLVADLAERLRELEEQATTNNRLAFNRA